MDTSAIWAWVLANIDPIIGGFVGTCAFVFVFWGLKKGVRLSARSLLRIVYIRRRDTANWVWRMWKSPGWREEVQRRETILFRNIVLMCVLYFFVVAVFGDITIESGTFLSIVKKMVIGIWAAVLGGEVGDYLKHITFRRSYLRLVIRREQKGK